MLSWCIRGPLSLTEDKLKMKSTLVVFWLTGCFYALPMGDKELSQSINAKREVSKPSLDIYNEQEAHKVDSVLPIGPKVEHRKRQPTGGFGSKVYGPVSDKVKRDVVPVVTKPGEPNTGVPTVTTGLSGSSGGNDGPSNFTIKKRETPRDQQLPKPKSELSTEAKSLYQKLEALYEILNHDGGGPHESESTKEKRDAVYQANHHDGDPDHPDAQHTKRDAAYQVDHHNGDGPHYPSAQHTKRNAGIQLNHHDGGPDDHDAQHSKRAAVYEVDNHNGEGPHDPSAQHVKRAAIYKVDNHDGGPDDHDSQHVKRVSAESQALDPVIAKTSNFRKTSDPSLGK